MKFQTLKWIAFLYFIHIVNAESCNDNLITGPKGVLDSAISASSDASFSTANKNVIRSTEPAGYGWIPYFEEKGEYIQIDFQTSVAIRAIITWGKGMHSQFVTSYTVALSQNGDTWTPVIGNNGNAQIFQGNTDDVSSQTNGFQKPLVAKAIRVIIETFSTTPVLKMELIGCAYTPFVGLDDKIIH